MLGRIGTGDLTGHKAWLLSTSLKRVQFQPRACLRELYTKPSMGKPSMGSCSNAQNRYARTVHRDSMACILTHHDILPGTGRSAFT